MVLTNFQIKNKLGQAQYFQKTFLLVDINIKVVLKYFFLSLLIQISNLPKKNLVKSFKLLSKL